MGGLAPHLDEPLLPKANGGGDSGDGMNGHGGNGQTAGAGDAAAKAGVCAV